MKYLITATLIALSLNLKAQTGSQAHPIKKDSAKYNYFVIVPLNDYQLMYGSSAEHQRLLMYDPTATNDQKMMLFKNVDIWFKSLPSRVKLDSVKVK